MLQMRTRCSTKQRCSQKTTLPKTAVPPQIFAKTFLKRLSSCPSFAPMRVERLPWLSHYPKASLHGISQPSFIRHVWTMVCWIPRWWLAENLWCRPPCLAMFVPATASFFLPHCKTFPTKKLPANLFVKSPKHRRNRRFTPSHIPIV